MPHMDARRALPAVDGLLRHPALRPLLDCYARAAVTGLVRQALDVARREAVEAAPAVATGYSALEFDLARGTRGSRYEHLSFLLQDVTGAEDGIAVNNNAAGLVLALAALCRRREVIVSRGQAVEIGGGFRIPAIMRESGAKLIEVGTTNRTRPSDYAAALSARTAAILRVHASNFRIVGFTETVDVASLAGLAYDRCPGAGARGAGACLACAAAGRRGRAGRRRARRVDDRRRVAAGRDAADPRPD